MHSISVMNPETIGVEWREESFFQNMNTKIDYSKSAYLLMGVRMRARSIVRSHRDVFVQEIERAWGEPKEGDESHVSVLVPHLQYQKWYIQDDRKNGNDVWRVIEAEQERLSESPVLVVNMDWGKFFQSQGLEEITKKIGWCSGHASIHTVPFAPGYNFLATPGNAERICRASGGKVNKHTRY